MESKLIDRVGYIIDKNGYVIDSIIVKSEFEEVKDNVVSISQPLGVSFYNRRWNGYEWVEGETVEEKEKREHLEYLNSNKPSQEEIEKAKFELQTIETLKSLGVVV